MKDNKKYDFYFVNSNKDASYINELSSLLMKEGYSTFYSKDILFGGDFFSSMVQAIRDAKALILFMTADFVSSLACQKETYIALEHAQNFDKLVIPIIDKSITIEDEYLSNITNKYNSIFINLDQKEIEESARTIVNHYESFLKKDLLYEKFAEYCQLKYDEGIIKTSSEIFKILIKQTPKLNIINDNNSSSYIELIEFLSKFYLNLNLSYSLEDRQLMDDVGEMLQPLKDLLDYKDFYHDLNNQHLSLLKVAIALHLLSLTFDLRSEVVDVKTNGDVHLSISEEEMRIRDNLKCYYDFLIETSFNKEQYKENELIIINDVNKLSILGWKKVSKEDKKKEDISSSKSEEENKIHKQLLEIAKYIDESNKLFESISSEDVTFEFLSCLKTSYERLKNYSEAADCKDIVAHCIEKLAFINQKLEGLSSDKNDEKGFKEGCFKALLGLAQPEVGTYDVFISYNHKDEDLAGSIYRFIKSNFLSAFYDKVSLPQLGKSEYHEAIMNAIDNANNFIIVLSDLSHLESHWVDLEMKTFNTELTEGRKDGNFIFIVTDDVFNEIVATNKKCLPIQYRGYEIMRTRDYKERLITYLRH